MNNLNLTAEERFENFCKKYPELIYKAAQKNLILIYRSNARIL